MDSHESGTAIENDLSGQPLLFQPLTIRGVTMRNRIMVSPMCQYVSQDGAPTDWHLVHLGKFAIGGAGLVFGDETAVEPRGRKTYYCAGIWADHQVPKYRRITDFLRSLGAVPAIQLGHSGSKGSRRDMEGHGAGPLTAEDAARGEPPWETVSPSPVENPNSAIPPREMARDDIRTVLNAWRDAARRSDDAGFDVLEVHAAHGYLIHQFLSPLTNHRTDGYGGDRPARMRFALEVAEAIRTVWPQHKPLFFRLSVIDGQGGVWDVRDTIALSKELALRGVDVIDCSSGGILGKGPMLGIARVPGYHATYSTRIRREAQVKTVALGLITEAHLAESLLQNGAGDIISMARGAMYESAWPVHAAKALGIPDYLDMFPVSYAHRLKLREDLTRQYPPGSTVMMSHTDDELVPYVWPEKPAATGT